MYPEGEGGGDLPPIDSGGSFKDKITYHLEGLIPVILIVVIALILGCHFDVLTGVPGVGSVCSAVNLSGSEPSRMLVVGTPSQWTMNTLNQNNYLVKYTVKSADSLGNNPENILANFSNYQIVMLDQTQQSSKEVSEAFGRAVQDFVGKGGKFILVRESGIRRPDSFDLLNWKGNFGKTVPVDCTIVGINNIPSCLNLQPVTGQMYPGAAGFKHPIMNGIEVIPSPPLPAQPFYVLADITTTGDEIAYIKALGSDKYYAGIVEAKTVLGKSIYFNYDPGTTPSVFQNTLRYLK